MRHANGVLAFGFGLLSGCGLLDLTYGEDNLKKQVVEGRDWVELRSDLVAKGYRPTEYRIPPGPGAKVENWTECLSVGVGALVMLAGGTRFVCVAVGEDGTIQRSEVSEQVLGL